MFKYYFSFEILERLRSQRWEGYLREAYGCVDCTVPLQMLNGETIARIRRGLVRPNRTRPKQNPIQNQQLSPRTQRRQDDDVFTPPVPFPAQSVEVETMNAHCE